MIYEKICLSDQYESVEKHGNGPTLEAYIPDNIKELKEENRRPCVLVLPGGGYAGCSRNEAETIALRFLAWDFNAFVLTYSVKPNKYPTQLIEVAAAFDYICNNSQKWNSSPEKIAIMGFSAGGHLAAHYSTSFDCREVRNVFPDSKRPFASILCYPVITARPELTHAGSFENLLGHIPNAEEIEKFSCDKLVSDNTPPAFIWHTASDNVVPVENSLLYAGALISHNIPAELHIYPYGWHGMSSVDRTVLGNKISKNTKHAGEWLKSLEKWIEVMFFNYEQ